jgi:SAM-dependent methyltransferase
VPDIRLTLGEGDFWEVAATTVFTPRRQARAPAQVDAICSLVGLAPPASVLDLACGVGRHAIVFAQFGYDVTGVDITAPYLDTAARRAAAADLQIELVHADMYDFVRPHAFGLIISMFSSIGYAEADDADRRLLENARRSLRPDGAIIVDTIGKELVGRTPARNWTRRDDEIILGEAQIVDGWRWLDDRVTRIRDGRCTELVFRYRLYSAAELRALAEAAGLTHAAIYGSLRGRPYDRHASRLILLAHP